jgi:hypothetical protein
VDDDVLALETADDRHAGQRQPRIERRFEPRLDRPAVVDGLAQEVLRCPNAKTGVIRDLERAAAGTL